MLGRSKFHVHRKGWIAFAIVFSACLVVGGLISLPGADVSAQADLAPAQPQQQQYGSQVCTTCHQNINSEWMTTRHSQAFSSPIFQQDWEANSSQIACLECHTTGYDAASGAYQEEGVTCVACHGNYQPGHPQTPMPIKADASLCSNCHKNTTDEWRASRHGAMNLTCQACHNPHTQTPKAESISELCTNCHTNPGNGFTHSSHASAGLECSNCHMYTAPRSAAATGGLVPTGHTFSVGSDACIGCHQDTVHTRDSIVRLTGEVQQAEIATVDELQQQVQEQQQTIDRLKTSNTVRLYTGLIQGALVGLITGGVAAWVVSRRIRIVEVGEDDK